MSTCSPLHLPLGILLHSPLFLLLYKALHKSGTFRVNCAVHSSQPASQLRQRAASGKAAGLYYFDTYGTHVSKARARVF